MRLAYLLPFVLLSLVACSSSSSSDSPADAGTSNSSGSSGTSSSSSSSSSSSGGSDGGTSTSSSSGSSGDQESLICQALASRSACPDGAVDCDEGARCLYGRLMLPAAAKAFASCRGAPSCKGDDTCVNEAGLAVGGAEATTYANDCRARSEACEKSFGNDYCAPALFAYGGADGVKGCLAKPCADIAACIANLELVQKLKACK